MLQKYEESYKCFSKVMKLDPSNTEAINELAEVQIQMLREKGYTRYQAGCAIRKAEDLQVCVLYTSDIAS